LEILALRKAHPTLGGKKISLMLKRKGVEGVPSGATVTSILRRHDLLNERAVAEATHLRRFSKAAPNEMWQVDFKGHFKLSSGERCHPLNAVDDCSRYAVISAPLLNETFEAVRPPFVHAFREYGLPETILCDNGNPWGVTRRNGVTAGDGAGGARDPRASAAPADAGQGGELQQVVEARVP
jgi:transposase InsO family protein